MRIFDTYTKKIGENIFLLKEKLNLVIDSEFNSEDYIKDKLLKLNFSVKHNNPRKDEVGIPDFICSKDKENPFYVEVKTNEDGLSFEQLSWIADNPLKKVYIYYVRKERKKRYPKTKLKICSFCTQPREDTYKTKDNKNICDICYERYNYTLNDVKCD